MYLSPLCLIFNLLFSYASSNDEKTITEKILQKLKLGNYQVAVISFCTNFLKFDALAIANFKFVNSCCEFLEVMLSFSFLQLGKTKVFLRAGQIGVLDSRRAEILDSSAKQIQSRLRTFLARKDFISNRLAAIRLQSCCRGPFSQYNVLLLNYTSSRIVHDCLISTK